MRKEFEAHKLNSHGLEKASGIAWAFDGLTHLLETLCREGRELSLAKTKLEESCFFAKKAMAIDPKNQEGTVYEIGQYADYVGNKARVTAGGGQCGRPPRKKAPKKAKRRVR